MFPTVATQRVQTLMQDRVINPLLQGKMESGKVPLLLRLFRAFPPLRRIPARLLGMGFRPEHVRPECAQVDSGLPSEKFIQPIYLFTREMFACSILRSTKRTSEPWGEFLAQSFDLVVGAHCGCRSGRSLGSFTRRRMAVDGAIAKCSDARHWRFHSCAQHDRRLAARFSQSSLHARTADCLHA